MRQHKEESRTSFRWKKCGMISALAVNTTLVVLSCAGEPTAEVTDAFKRQIEAESDGFRVHKFVDLKLEKQGLTGQGHRYATYRADVVAMASEDCLPITGAMAVVGDRVPECIPIRQIEGAKAEIRTAKRLSQQIRSILFLKRVKQTDRAHPVSAGRKVLVRNQVVFCEKDHGWRCL